MRVWRQLDELRLMSATILILDAEEMIPDSCLDLTLSTRLNFEVVFKNSEGSDIAGVLFIDGAWKNRPSHFQARLRGPRTHCRQISPTHAAAPPRSSQTLALLPSPIIVRRWSLSTSFTVPTMTFHLLFANLAQSRATLSLVAHEKTLTFGSLVVPFQAFPRIG